MSEPESSVPKHEPERDPSGKWKPGQTGNRSGRPKGQTWHQRMRRELQESTPAVLARLLDLAMAGNTDAARLILSRSLAPVRDNPVKLPDMAGSLSDQARGIMSQVAAGTIPPSVGNELLAGLANVGRAIEIAEFDARLKAIEATQAARQPGTP